MLETMYYGNNNDGTIYHRKPSFSTSSDPAASTINYTSPTKSTMTKSHTLNGNDGGNHHASSGVYNNYDGSSSSSNNNNNNNNNNASNRSTAKTPFEKLIENLKTNPDYKKEMYLNRLIGFYRIGSEIGTGNFSQVRLGLHLLTREKVAIKILNKMKLDEKTQRLLLREISSMQKLHHPNIIRLYEVIHTQERLFICMEYAPEGELYTKISNEGRLNETHARIIFSQVLSAIEHMHANRIIHRDIKAENIFFSCLDPYVIKVGDLGFSTEASVDKYLNTYCGSPPYAAPELFRDDNYIGIYVDIWALGVLLYFIVTGLMPFKADTVSKLKRVILGGDYVIPSFVSDACQLLIKGILRPVPNERFTIREIKDSAWLDHENQIDPLEPFQLNPTLDKSELKSEELYTIKFLDKLGITKNCLIACNLPATPINSAAGGEHYHAPLTHFRSHMHLSTSTAAGLDGSSAHASINTMMDNLISNKSTLNYLSSQAYNYQRASSVSVQLTNDLKQSVNGTYRIVFHSVQKKLRNEWNSEELGESFVSREFRVLFGEHNGHESSNGWNGANLTLNELQKHQHQHQYHQQQQHSPTHSHNNNNTTTTTTSGATGTYYDDRWISLDDDDDSSHGFNSRHPLSKAITSTTKNFHRININPHTTTTTTTTTTGQATNGNMNREMVNLGSLDNEDEKAADNKSVISSNKNSNESSSGGGGGGGGHHTAGPTPTKSIFVRLNSRNAEQQSVQSAPLGNEISVANKVSSSSGPTNYRQTGGRAYHSGSSNQHTLKSSKSVPRQIYASQNGLNHKSNSISSNSSKQQQYSKLCSII